MSEALADWNAGIDPLPDGSARAIGRQLIRLGAGAILAGMFLTPPWANLGLAVGLAGVLLARPPLHRLAATWVGLAFAGWLLLSVAAGALRGEPHGGKLPGAVHAWLCLPLLAAAAVDATWRRWAFRVLVASAGVAGLLALAQFCIGFDLHAPPLRVSVFGDRFVIARGFSASHLMLGFAGALTAALAVQPPGMFAAGAAWTWAGRGLGILVLAICGSRAALVGGLAGLGTALAARGRRWFLTAAAVVLVLAGGMVGRMALSDPGRLARMLHGDDGRWVIWSTSLAMARDHPLLGMGGREAYMFAYNDAFARANPGRFNEFAHQEGSPHAHDWLLALVVEHGLPAATLELALVGTVLAVCWRRRREQPAAWSTAAAIAVIGLVDGAFEPLPTLAVPGAAFHACLGLALGLALSRAAQPAPAA